MNKAPKYYAEVENLKKKLEYYEAGYATSTGYDHWMYGRRVGEYRGFLHNLRQNVHETILGVNDSSVCCCALMIPETEDELFWLFDGHRDYNLQPVKTFYFYKYEAEKEPQLMLHCQLCESTTPAEVNEDNDPIHPPKCNCNIEDPAQTFDI